MIGRWMASAFYGAGVNVVIDVYIMGIWSCLGDWRGEVQDTLILINDLFFLCNSFDLPGVGSEWNCAKIGRKILRAQMRWVWDGEGWERHCDVRKLYQHSVRGATNSSKGYSL